MNACRVKIGLVQMRMRDSQEENLERALRMISDAAGKGANVVCLPELFSARYFAQYRDRASAMKFAEGIPGRTVDALGETARENKVVLVGGSIYEKSGNKLYNTSVVFDEDGSVLGKYRKMHIPHDERFWEKDYFDEGDLGFKVFQTKYGKIGVLICYDQWFPEAARAVSLLGADIIFYPTAIGTVEGVGQVEGDWHSAWENVMRGHAIANGVFTCGVNRAGKEDKLDFWGGSFLCDAFGTTLKRAGKGEEVLVVDADLGLGRRVKEGWGFFGNRRPDAYGAIAKGKV